MKLFNARSAIAIGAGVLMGLGLRLYGGSGNGYQVGPGILAATIVLGLGAAGSAVSLATGRRHGVAGNLLVFCITAIAAVYLLARIWPYAEPPGPVPLQQLERENR